MRNIGVLRPSVAWSEIDNLGKRIVNRLEGRLCLFLLCILIYSIVRIIQWFLSPIGILLSVLP